MLVKVHKSDTRTEAKEEMQKIIMINMCIKGVVKSYLE